MRSGAVAYVIAPSGDGLQVTIIKEGIKAALMMENQQWLSQASHTPFLQEPRYELIDDLAVTDFACKILGAMNELHLLPPTGM